MKIANGGKHVDTQNTSLPKVHKYRDVRIFFGRLVRSRGRTKESPGP